MAFDQLGFETTGRLGLGLSCQLVQPTDYPCGVTSESEQCGPIRTMPARMVHTKRKLDIETSYTPSFRLVTSHQVHLAIAEFHRLECEGKEHGRVLVAQRVPLVRWRRSQIPLSFGRVAFEADYKDSAVTKKTKADLYIAKVPGLAHECGINLLISQLVGYIQASGNLLLAGGGDMHLPGKDRCPDAAIRPFTDKENPPMPRLICEIEITHRGLHEILA